MRDEDGEVAGAEAEAVPGGAPAPRRVASMWAGAGAALALVTGLGVWIYDLGTRPTEGIPVVAAARGPVKVVPEGGESPVGHRDIGSFEMTRAPEPAAGTTEAPTTLAPEAAPLTEEDISLRDLEDILGVPEPTAAAVPRAAIPLAAPDGTVVPDTRPAPGASAPVPLPPAKVEPAPERTAALPPEPEPEPEAEADPGAPAPRVSPIAPRRPDNLPARVAAAQREAIEDVAALRTRAARSRFQIQLGAYKTEGEVHDEWRRISGDNTDLLNNRALAVQTTQSGGITWYRLRVGPFESQAEALSLCEALHAREQRCIAVRNR